MKRKAVILTSIISIVLVVLGGSFAWIIWTSSVDTGINLLTNIAKVNFNMGNDINATNIGPVMSSNDGEYLEFEMRTTDNVETTYFSVKFTPTALPTVAGVVPASVKYKLVSGNSYGNYTNTVIEGNLAGSTVENDIYLVNNQAIATTMTYYKLIFWIDGTVENATALQGTTLAGTVEVMSGPPVQDIPTPTLLDGMIPVMYNGTNWVKADMTNINNNYKWYDYTNKQWANAIMVSSSYRSTYMNSTTIGTTIPESNILGYYVWIPRYAYQVFNINSLTQTDSERVIPIRFQNTNDEKYTASNDGAWQTHPAFTWNTGVNAKELSGLWVGKFETSGSSSQPKVLPNEIALTTQNVSTQYDTANNMMSTTYLTSTGVGNSDVHMMKNTEWGAVAYLKQSIYGLGINDLINNSNVSYYTGGGTSNYYKTNLNQSTTGNIYGVFDMAGGTAEYVMGVEKDNLGSSVNYGNDGFTTSTLPYSVCESNTYLNCYNYDGSSASTYYRRILGDATGETNGWYSDYALFVNSTSSWFYRGGSNNSNNSAGIFAFSSNGGIAGSDMGFRIVGIKTT